MEGGGGTANSDFASALAIEAEALHGLGRLAEARALILRAIAIFDQVFGRDHLNNYLQLITLAEIELSLSQPARALAALERGRSLIQKAQIDPVNRAQMDFLTARGLVAEHASSAQARALALSARAVLAADGNLKKELAEIDRFIAQQGWHVAR